MNKERGFISLLLLILISLALLKYFFNWSIFDAIESERGRATISYLRDIINLTWSYLAAPLAFIWEEILRPLLDLAIQTFRNMAKGWGSINLG